MMPQPAPHPGGKSLSTKPPHPIPAAAQHRLHHSPAESSYSASSLAMPPPSPSKASLDDELLIFIVNSLLNSDRVLLRTTVTSFFHPDARLINPLMRVQGRDMVYRLYRCATVFNHPRAAVHKVYRSRDGEAAMDITIHITPKWLPITVRIPFVVIIRFRLMLDRPLIIEQYDHYGPLLALPCSVPGVQFLLENLVQPLVGLGITTLAWGVDVMEDVGQVVQSKVQSVVGFYKEVSNWLNQQLIAPLQHYRKVQQMKRMEQEKEQQHLLSQAAKLEQMERNEQDRKWQMQVEKEQQQQQEADTLAWQRAAQMQQQAEALAAAAGAGQEAGSFSLPQTE